MQPMDHGKGLRSTVVGIMASALLALIKGVGGFLGNSYALIADAIESLTDVFTSIMLWLGLRWSARPPDKDHPYGHGKGEAIIALGIAFALCGAAIAIAIKSFQNIQTPHGTPRPYTLLILALVVVTKEILYRFVLKTGHEINSGAVKADAVHHRSDAITSAAAFIGISIALIGGKGYEGADDCAALFGSVIILFNAYKIARPAIGELLDEDLDPKLTQEIRTLASQVDDVAFVEQCRVRTTGVFKIADLHVWVDKHLTVEKGHEIAHNVKAKIQETYPFFADVMIHIEPTK
jgi:cation diffusion facilitator family transporter